MTCAGCGGRSLRDMAPLSPGSADLSLRPGPRLTRCASCGLVQVVPRAGPEELRDHYRTEYLHRASTRTRLSTGRVRLFQHYLERLEREAPGRRLLDVGCGGGDFLAEAARRGWDPVGLELSRGAAEAGAARGLTILEGGPADLPPGRFHAVTLWNVLDQMPDPARELAPLPGLLEPGGILLVRVPNLVFHLAAWRVWRLLFPGRRPPTVFHPLVFDAPRLAGFLGRQGLQGIQVENSVLTESPIPGLPGPAAAALRPLSSGIAALLSGLTGGRLLVAPSLVAWARPMC